MIAFIESALGKKAKIVGKQFHVADLWEIWADISKAERLIGWRPRVPPEDGFKKTLDWHLGSRAWGKN